MCGRPLLTTLRRAAASAQTMDMQLAKLLHRRIVVLGPKLLDQPTLESVNLIGVDPACIWIESEKPADRIAERFRVKPAEPSAFFIPFSQIVTIIAAPEGAAKESAAA
jgi:hypothetical protein